jgi:uncharacterized membrane protein
MQIRSAQIKPLNTPPASSTSGSAGKETPPASTAPNQEKEKRPPIVGTSESMGSRSITLPVESKPTHEKREPAPRREARWWEKVWGRKRLVRRYEV